jgi:hypothetical protein
MNIPIRETNGTRARPAGTRPAEPASPPAASYPAFRLFQLAVVGLGTALLAIQADAAVGIAAPVAWASLLAVLLADRRPEVRLARVRVCIDTATAGIGVLMVGLAMGDVSWPWLLASQAVMAAAFLPRYRAMRLSPWRAAAAWFVVLDGVYLLVWTGLWVGGVR